MKFLDQTVWICKQGYLIWDQPKVVCIAPTMGIQHSISGDGSQELSRNSPAQKTPARVLLFYPFLFGYKQMPRSVPCRIAIIIICNDLILKCHHQIARNSVSSQSPCAVAVHSWRPPAAPAWYRQHATIAGWTVFWCTGEPCLVQACCTVMMWFHLWCGLKVKLTWNEILWVDLAEFCMCKSARSLVVWYCPWK